MCLMPLCVNTASLCEKAPGCRKESDAWCMSWSHCKKQLLSILSLWPLEASCAEKSKWLSLLENRGLNRRLQSKSVPCVKPADWVRAYASAKLYQSCHLMVVFDTLTAELARDLCSIKYVGISKFQVARVHLNGRVWAGLASCLILLKWPWHFSRGLFAFWMPGFKYICLWLVPFCSWVNRCIGKHLKIFSLQMNLCSFMSDLFVLFISLQY